MSNNLVSVIIPTYNRAQLVVEAIKSVEMQSYPAVQIIVIDDGSVDNTAQIVAAFKNVEYYYQENKGQAAARNLGLSYAKGEYIASLDSDDIWHKDFLERAVAALERYETDFVFLNWTEISETKQSLSDWRRLQRWQKYSKNTDGEWALLNPAEVRKLYIETCPAPSSALLIRQSSFISGWNENMKIADDWYLILEMVTLRSCNAAFTLSPHWTKRVDSNNIYDGRDLFEVTVELGLHDEPLMLEHFLEHITHREKSVMKRRLAGHHLNFGRLHWRRYGLSSEALRSVATAFTIAPMGSVFHFTQITLDYLKNRYNIVRDKNKQFPEI